MSMMVLLLFVLGLVLLIVGAEALVKGSSRLAAALGISPLVIGLTVVAYGTGSAELAVSIHAGLSGQADLALGNVVGSNIFNVLFLLGLAAIITPLVVSQQLIRYEVPLMIAVSLLVLLLALDGRLSRLDGLLLFSINVVYVVWAIRQSRREKQPVKEEYERQYGARSRSPQWLVNLALIIAGLGLLVLGSRWLVEGAVVVAQALGLSELIIGLTIIAAGTSLPEVATSIIASLRRERDIAVGNVVGSNIFNLLAVLGLASLFAPHGVKVPPAALRFDIPVMMAVAFACLPVFFTGFRIGRREGALLFACYLAYTLYLILDATGHDRVEAFSLILFKYVTPLVALTLILLAAHAWHRRQHGPAEGV
ncbi:MAG: calcium/sodium antiporter [candidate division KSB1 bacterium]|nr:calcium/sodium antiporter [candidate division KSB1 bacterium]MDZ7273458.1 calcium/sodium antiporter [candidate division KSB1 bacterium]MDZ7286950.1 calcium/sodium antiporter [candidate division KSB1 bacterium]MDZ7299697.1 calcium/sodium antiporter [candidate division KSB1 bacterium]MDZ7308705.1 calcium/sodium antiporter [candidate division KSB1 bacterium]